MNTRQVHLAAHFPGVNNQTVWSDPRSGSHIEFDSFRSMARTAERGLFDFFFLAEGLRLREHRGEIFDLDVVGRPDNVSVLSALAAVTEHLGLAGTLSTTFNEPYDLARKFSTLDQLSQGRAAWNAVTTHDAFTGANFRRGGYLDAVDRYRRAEDFVSVARTLWESRLHGGTGAFRHRSEFFDVRGTYPASMSPQVHPVVFQAGDSPAGRDFAAGSADAIFTRHFGLEEGKDFYRDVTARLAAHGRDEDELKVFPATTFVLGDTEEEARERSRALSYEQISGPGALAFLERTWGTDLSGYDPEGPLPEIEPVFDETVSQGRVRALGDPRATVSAWRELAERKNLSIRELVVEVSGGHNLVGTPSSVAETMARTVQERAADGFILVPSVAPGGLEEFVDRVVPELQERGAYREEYPGTTLRENLGLGPYRPEARWAEARTRARRDEAGSTSSTETAGDRPTGRQSA